MKKMKLTIIEPHTSNNPSANTREYNYYKKLGFVVLPALEKNQYKHKIAIDLKDHKSYIDYQNYFDKDITFKKDDNMVMTSQAKDGMELLLIDYDQPELTGLFNFEKELNSQYIMYEKPEDKTTRHHFILGIPSVKLYQLNKTTKEQVRPMKGLDIDLKRTYTNGTPSCFSVYPSKSKPKKMNLPDTKDIIL